MLLKCAFNDIKHYCDDSEDKVVDSIKVDIIINCKNIIKDRALNRAQFILVLRFWIKCPTNGINIFYLIQTKSISNYNDHGMYKFSFSLYIW